MCQYAHIEFFIGHNSQAWLTSCIVNSMPLLQLNGHHLEAIWGEKNRPECEESTLKVIFAAMVKLSVEWEFLMGFCWPKPFFRVLSPFFGVQKRRPQISGLIVFPFISALEPASFCLSLTDPCTDSRRKASKNWCALTFPTSSLRTTGSVHTLLAM